MTYAQQRVRRCSLDSASVLVYQTVGGTFPSLSQTGEGFLLQFDNPRLTLSAEEEWLRACVPMRRQGKTRRACVDRSRRARPTSYPPPPVVY